MRIFAVSDLHIDYAENAKWLFGLPKNDYNNDILVLAGDISSNMQAVIKAFAALKSRFYEVLFIPGNHDLWIDRNNNRNSFDNFHLIKTIAANCGIVMEPAHYNTLSIVPLFGWYDYSFGEPAKELYDIWIDYTACVWPDGYDESSVTQTFISMNSGFLKIKNDFLITFSHFLPRIDLMPPFIPQHKRNIYPVLGTVLLEKHIRQLRSNMHIYGHSHVNTSVMIDGIRYINNAYGYPSEKRIASKKLLKIYEL